MRIRNKPWAKEELNSSKFYVQNPEEAKGKWKEYFKNPNNPIHLELGCGKGYFVKKAAIQNSEINYIAIDLIDAILGVANYRIFNRNTKSYNEQKIKLKKIARFQTKRYKKSIDKLDMYVIK